MEQSVLVLCVRAAQGCTNAGGPYCAAFLTYQFSGMVIGGDWQTDKWATMVHFNNPIRLVTHTA